MPKAQRTAIKKTAAKPKKAVAKKKTSKTSASKKKVVGKKKSIKKVSGHGFTEKAITKKQTKSQIMSDLADEMELDKKTVKKFFEALKNHIARHMKKRGSGEMTIPELGIKVKRVKKAATKARKGRNPFTGEEIMIAAKPASTVVKASALKVLKELVD